MDEHIHLLFTSGLTSERWTWLNEVVKGMSPQQVHFHLTGEALFSLFYSKTCLSAPERIHWDAFEARILGLDLESNSQFRKNPKRATGLSFWGEMVEDIKANFPSARKFNLLHNTGPYMSRDSVYAVRYIQAAFNAHQESNLYCYLDGVHMGNSLQGPSEFQNIGYTLEEVSQKHSAFTMLACARCGKARGYISREEGGNSFFSNKVIRGFSFVNLRHIVKQCAANEVILTLPGGVVLSKQGETASMAPPSLLILITHPPYGTEWAFGAISLAMAAMQQGIPVQVTFIEDGVYGLTHSHKIPLDEGIFNMQEIIQSVEDEIAFSYYWPSSAIRGLGSEKLSINAQKLDSPLLQRLIMNNSKGERELQRRLLFF